MTPAEISEACQMCKENGENACSTGRSMIEMLGVLAIIGVLSVGGIAGYSKAMEKWKINKTIEEYSMLITGLIEYKDNFIKNTPTETDVYLPDFIQAANLVPETWKKGGSSYMYDTLGNRVNIYFSNTENISGTRYVFDIWFAQSASSNNSLAYNLCRAFYQDVGIAMSSNVLAIIVQRGKHFAYGDTLCHEGTDEKGNPRHCLRDMKLSEISDICKTCQTTNCAVYLVF
mgnify:FL=1